jgi:hypothetical protein
MNLDDSKDEYKVNPFTTIEYLKHLIYERKYITEFELFKGNIFLETEKSLQDYDITPDDTLIMIPDSRIRSKNEPNLRILPIMTIRPRK